MFLNGRNRTLFCWVLDLGGMVSPPLPISHITWANQEFRCIKEHAGQLTFHQNMHELACVSGIAAAYRLGAEYKSLTALLPRTSSAKYLFLSHGVIYSREEKRRKKKQA